jgi:hypothetical protein
MKNTITTYYKSKLGIVRDSSLSDVFILADNLRQEDIAEVWKSHHKTPGQALFDSFSNSVLCFTIEVNETPIAMFGLVPHAALSRVAIIWLLASPELEKVQRAFLRQSRYFIELLLDHYPLLFNYVDIHNAVSIKWLKWLGADFGPTIPYGVEQQYFQYFQFERCQKIR